jgi:hypothetical protein
MSRRYLRVIVLSILASACFVSSAIMGPRRKFLAPSAEYSNSFRLAREYRGRDVQFRVGTIEGVSVTYLCTHSREMEHRGVVLLANIELDPQFPDLHILRSSEIPIAHLNIQMHEFMLYHPRVALWHRDASNHLIVSPSKFHPEFDQFDPELKYLTSYGNSVWLSDLSEADAWTIC